MSISTVAIITGASKGLGHALALGLISPANHIITLSRSHDSVLETQAAQTGCALKQIQVDLSDPAAARHSAGQIMANLPGNAQRYLLINNAGTVDPVRSAENLIDASLINIAFNLNVTSVMVLTAAFLQATSAFGADRRVLNISSGAGRNATAGWGVYCATKAALDRYTQVLSAEQHGVRIVALAPGVIDTGMQTHLRSSDPAQFPNLSRFVDLHKQGKLAPPVAVAARILNYIDRDDFGTTVLDDLRNYA